MKKMTPALLHEPRFGRFIGEAFRQHKAWASGNILLRCIAMSTRVFWPLYIKLMTDELVIVYTTQQINWEKIIWINILGFSLGWFIEDLAAITANVISASRIAKMRARIRMFILNDMFYQSQQFFHDRFAGTISTSMRDISESVSDIFSEIMDRVIPVTVIFVVLGYIFFKMHISYVLIMIVWMIFQITLVYLTRKKAQKNHVTMQISAASYSEI